jgi:integrase/recombinase XerD
MPKSGRREKLPTFLYWGPHAQEYIEEFRASQGRSQATRVLDRVQIERLSKWMVARGIFVEKFTAKDAATFITSLDSKLTARGVNLCLQACRSFGDFLVLRKVWTDNPFRSPEIGKRREVVNRKPQGLSKEELEALLAAPDRRRASGLRDFLVLYVLAFTGMRSGEVCNLRLSDLHRDSCRVRVAGETTKTRTERWPWLPHTKDGRGHRTLKPELLKPLEQWLVIRETLGVGPDGPLFVNVSRHPLHRDQGQPLTPRQVQQMVLRNGRRAGIARRLHPHQLRHTAGFLMARGGLTSKPMSPDQIMEQLGHVSLTMTLHYSKGTEEDTGDAFAAADISGAVRVPTRERPRVLQPRDLQDKKRVLEVFGVSAEDMREMLQEG